MFFLDDTGFEDTLLDYYLESLLKEKAFAVQDPFDDKKVRLLIRVSGFFYF